jgi:hypothetical protein
MIRPSVVLSSLARCLLASTLGVLALAGCGEEGGEASPAPAPSASVGNPQGSGSIRGNRYCELLLIYLKDGKIDAQVWGTQGLNDCPAASWGALDGEALRVELGATMVTKNGPRYWLIDDALAKLPDQERRTFGGLEMQKLATIAVEPGATASQPYKERTINRNSEFKFRAGAEVYEILAPGGSIYVMQSYAQIVDPALGEEALPTLGSRLALPAGWTYRARKLEQDLVVSTPGQATVLQDELQNTYSRYVTGS